MRASAPIVTGSLCHVVVTLAQAGSRPRNKTLGLRFIEHYIDPLNTCRVGLCIHKATLYEGNDTGPF